MNFEKIPLLRLMKHNLTDCRIRISYPSFYRQKNLKRNNNMGGFCVNTVYYAYYLGTTERIFKTRFSRCMLQRHNAAIGTD